MQIPLSLNPPPHLPPTIEELWTATDAQTLDRLHFALANDDLALALLAIEGATPEATDRALSTLNDWTDRLLDLPLDPPAEALRRLLTQELGFQGDTEDYDHPRNSSLSLVIERRRGLPILLVSLWMILGQRVGFDVQGIGMPGHFLASVEGQLTDPFHSGEALSREDAVQLYLRTTGGSSPWQDDFLDPIPFPRLIERVIWNLVNTYNRRNEPLRFYRHARLLAELFPDRPQLQMIHATAAEAASAHPLALDLFRQIADRFDHTSLGKLAARRASRIQRSLVARC